MADPILRAYKRCRRADERMGAAVLCPPQKLSYAPHFPLLKPSLLLVMLTCKTPKRFFGPKFVWEALNERAKDSGLSSRWQYGV